MTLDKKLRVSPEAHSATKFTHDAVIADADVAGGGPTQRRAPLALKEEAGLGAGVYDVGFGDFMEWKGERREGPRERERRREARPRRPRNVRPGPLRSPSTSSSFFLFSVVASWDKVENNSRVCVL